MLAYCYVLNSYILGDLYLRNAGAEFVALCVAPLALWGLLRIEQSARSGGILLAAALAIIVFSHNLTALCVTAMVSVLALVLYPPWRSPRSCGVAFGSIFIGLLASAVFWYPAIILKGFVRTDLLTVGKFGFRMGFQNPTTWFGHKEFFSPGWVPIGLLGITLAGALWSLRAPVPGRRRALWFAMLMAGVLILLQTPSSTPIWQAIPWLRLFQFPWRFMGPFVLVTVFGASAAVASMLPRQRALVLGLAEGAVLILAVADALPCFRAYTPLAPEVRNSLPNLLAPASIRIGGLTATVLDEYLPVGANPQACSQFARQENPLIGTSGEMEGFRAEQVEPRHIQLRMRSRGPVSLYFSRWAFPGWHAEVDGLDFEVSKGPYGVLSVSVPAGTHAIELVLRPPAARNYALLISALSTLAGFFWAFGRTRGLWQRSWPTSPKLRQAPNRRIKSNRTKH